MSEIFKYKFRLDGRRKLDDGTYPIKVNIHHIPTNINRDYALHKSGYAKLRKLSATKIDFDSIWINRFRFDNFGEIIGETTIHGKKQEIRVFLKSAANKFDEIITRKNVYTHQDIIEAYRNYRNFNPDYQSSDGQSPKVKEAFNLYIEDLEREGRFKTAKGYRTTLNNMMKFDSGIKDNRNYALGTIDVEWLNSYDRHRRNLGKSAASIGVDTRNIRTIMNRNYTDELTRSGCYPFGKDKYQPPTSKAKNQGLEKEDLKKILNFSSDNTYLQEARDYFIFTYFAGGMNLKDIALLEKNQRAYIRSKTKFTQKNQFKIDLEFNKHQLDIIERNKGKKHLFNILDGIDDVDPNQYHKQLQKRIDNKVSSIDKQLKKLAVVLEIPHKISLNWARHSFATNLYQDGINIKAIGESMGHSNLKTTQGYLDSLVDRNKNLISDALSLDD